MTQLLIRLFIRRPNSPQDPRVRAAYGNLGRVDMTLAVPLNRAGFLTQRPDPRLLVSFTTQFGVRAR